MDEQVTPSHPEKIYCWTDEDTYFNVSLKDPPPQGTDYIELPGDYPFDFENLQYYVRNGKLGTVRRIVITPRTETQKMQDELKASNERIEFLEDCLAELINEVYSE